MQRHSETSLKIARSLANCPSLGEGGWGRSMYPALPGNFSVPYLSFVYGRSLWAELNGGGNSLHWKANMLLLFNIMTLCGGQGILYRAPIFFNLFNIFSIKLIFIFLQSFFMQTCIIWIYLYTYKTLITLIVFVCLRPCVRILDTEWQL